MNTPRIVICMVLSLHICLAESSSGRTSHPPSRTNATLTAGDYRTVASGSWNSLQTWERFVGGAWTVPLAAPDSGSGRITVRSGDTVSITAATTYDQLTVEAGGQVIVLPGVPHTLTDGPGDDLTIEGTWVNQGGSWTIVGGAKSVSYTHLTLPTKRIV